MLFLVPYAYHASRHVIAICTATFIGNQRRIERYAAIRAEHGISLGIQLNAVSDVVMTIIKR